MRSMKSVLKRSEITSHNNPQNAPPKTIQLCPKTSGKSHERCPHISRTSAPQHHPHKSPPPSENLSIDAVTASPISRSPSRCVDLHSDVSVLLFRRVMTDICFHTSVVVDRRMTSVRIEKRDRTGSVHRPDRRGKYLSCWCGDIDHDTWQNLRALESCILARSSWRDLGGEWEGWSPTTSKLIGISLARFS